MTKQTEGFFYFFYFRNHNKSNTVLKLFRELFENVDEAYVDMVMAGDVCLTLLKGVGKPTLITMEKVGEFEMSVRPPSKDGTKGDLIFKMLDGKKVNKDVVRALAV